MGCNIGIYNLHMRGMGGGEKLTLGLAERLSLDHKVTIFCGEQLDLQALEQFFAVDLSRVKAISLENHGPLAKLASKVPGIRGQATVSDHYRQLKKLNLDIFINFGRNEKRCERSFAASAGIERRNPDKPVNARFG